MFIGFLGFWVKGWKTIQSLAFDNLLTHALYSSVVIIQLIFFTNNSCYSLFKEVRRVGGGGRKDINSFDSSPFMEIER